MIPAEKVEETKIMQPIKKNQPKKLEDETIRCSIVVQNEPHARLTKCQEAFQRSGNLTEIKKSDRIQLLPPPKTKQNMRPHGLGNARGNRICKLVQFHLYLAAAFSQSACKNMFILD